MPADSIYINFETLVFSFNDHAPKVEEIDAAIVKAKETAGVNAVEIVVRPEFTNVLLDALIEQGFRRVGTVSTNTTTWMRWAKRLDAPQVTDEGKKLTAMRAGLNDLVKH
jgi:hypothetical protein